MVAEAGAAGAAVSEVVRLLRKRSETRLGLLSACRADTLPLVEQAADVPYRIDYDGWIPSSPVERRLLWPPAGASASNPNDARIAEIVRSRAFSHLSAREYGNPIHYLRLAEESRYNDDLHVRENALKIDARFDALCPAGWKEIDPGGGGPPNYNHKQAKLLLFHVIAGRRPELRQPEVRHPNLGLMQTQLWFGDGTPGGGVFIGQWDDSHVDALVSFVRHALADAQLKEWIGENEVLRGHAVNDDNHRTFEELRLSALGQLTKPPAGTPPIFGSCDGCRKPRGRHGRLSQGVPPHS